MRAQLGPTYGDRFLRRFSEDPSLVFDLIEKHQIRCDVTKTGTIHAAHGPKPGHLPRVHQLAPGLWTAIGYNGRGITTGTLFGIAMADLLTGLAPADLPLPVTEMTKAPRTDWTSRVYDLAFTANQVWKGLV